MSENSYPSASTTATINLPLPVGTVISYMGTNPASLAVLGWVPCDGRAVSSQSYPDLYAAVGTTYGGDGNPNFNLPNLIGMFQRGIDSNGAVDPDAASRTSPISGNATVVGPVIGSRQGFQVQNHQHNWSDNFGQITWSGSDLNVQLAPNSPHGGNQGTQATTDWDGGGNETRPYNTYVYFLIFTGLPQTQQPGGASQKAKPVATKKGKPSVSAAKNAKASTAAKKAKRRN